jgi:hypothetical protein
MAPVCRRCKQAISALHPGKQVNNEWQHIPSCPKPGQRPGPVQRVAQLWRATAAWLKP